MTQETIHCNGEAALLMFAEQFSAKLKAGLVVYLKGDLGAGKTTFVRGVLRALGYQGKVKSPTYNLFETYTVGEHRICHIDLYRLESSQELDAIGLRDYFDQQHICFVEWPEHAAEHLPSADWTISIAMLGEGRELVIAGL